VGHRALIVVAVAVALACAHAKPLPSKAAADLTRATSRGSTFVVPAGWSMSTDGGLVILTSPEKSSRVAIVESALQDPDAAVTAAWKAFEPGTTWSLRDTRHAPGREGWDAIDLYEYDVPPNARRAISAEAARHGVEYTVALFDLDQGVAEKRAAQLALIFAHFAPPGFQRESFAGKRAHALDAARVAKLLDFVEKARVALAIPGVGVGLVQDGKVVYAGGLGVRELGKPAPVDADTLFMIGSNTKALTTLLLARLVDAGRLGWDTPVTKLMPEFKLGDAETTRQVLVRHLVCACTGLPRQDMEWIFEFAHATPASELQLLGTFQPTTKFGETYQYSNLLAAAGGFVAARVLSPGRELGAAYDDAMFANVFDPLGMSSTTFDFARARAGNHAAPYGRTLDGAAAPVDPAIDGAIIPLRPAGGAWSSVNDLLRYVELELAGGVLPDGKRLVSEAALDARRAPQVAIGADEAYGMGLHIDRTTGIEVVHHGGSLAGFKSDMIFLPDHGVGAVILTNSDAGQELLEPFRRRLLELLFDGDEEAETDVAASARGLAEQLALQRKLLTSPADGSALAARYTNPSLGELAIVKQGADTIFDVGEWRTLVASRRNDDGTTSLVTISPGTLGLVFVEGSAGGVRTLTLRDAQHEYVFTEKR
jgi:CubicO group peptidase (beta-lactamase class C family)